MNNKLVVFRLDEQPYALRLPTVERIVRAVEVAHLPKAPEMVLGVINVQGRIIPVADIRGRFDLPEKALTLSDQMIIVRTSKWTLALVVDTVSGVIECPDEDLIKKEKIMPDAEYVEGVVRLKDGMILIADIHQFLPLEGQWEPAEAVR